MPMCNTHSAQTHDEQDDAPFDAPWQAIKYTLCLTEMQLKILQCMFLGLTVDNTARELGISSSQVLAHLERVYRKTHVNGRPELDTWICEAFVALPMIALMN